MTATTFKELVAQLQAAEIVPRPENEEWKALIDRISTPARIAAIDEETYWYFLEVLPPKYQRGNLFAFAEGCGSNPPLLAEGRSVFLPATHVG